MVIEEIIALMKMYISRYVKLEGQRPGEPSAEVLAEELRVNTTLTSLNLGCNALEEGGGRALAEALRLNTTERERETERLKEFVRNNRIGM